MDALPYAQPAPLHMRAFVRGGITLANDMGNPAFAVVARAVTPNHQSPMLYFRCTADVQRAIGLHKPIEPSNAPLGHRMVNRFMVERRKAYIFMSDSTLLSFILLSGKVPMTPQRLPDMLIGGLVQLLQIRDFPGDAIARAIDPYIEFRYAKNDNRTAMGCMNDMVWRYQSMIDYMGGLAHCDLTEIIFQINKTPQRTIGWANSWDLAESKLRTCS